MNENEKEILSRLQHEYNEVEDRICRLVCFLKRPNLENTMDVIELELLKEQKNVMVTYLAILKHRIEYLKNKYN